MLYIIFYINVTFMTGFNFLQFIFMASVSKSDMTRDIMDCFIVKKKLIKLRNKALVNTFSHLKMRNTNLITLNWKVESELIF